MDTIHHRREWMEAPQREYVVAIASHRIEVVDPEVALPYFRNVCLSSVGAVGVTGGSQIERNVELDPAPRDMRLVVRVLQ